jgi:uncharacterized zinc-type alcohol dehydrogenase-like protein
LAAGAGKHRRRTFASRRGRSLAGSAVGSIKETQEMLDFCGTHNIVPEIEVISIQQTNGAYERILGSDVRYRFVIDIASLCIFTS